MAKKKVVPETKAVGRPTKYDPAYCDKLTAHMGQGLSFESFAGLLGVSRSTLYEWEKNHAEFSDTKKKAEEMSLLKWEQLGLAGMVGKIPGFNAAVYIFNMKNRFRWRDQVQPEPAREQQEAENALADALRALDSKQGKN